MSDMFRHIQAPEIGGYFERMGLESMNVDEKLEHLLYTEEAFDSITDTLIASTADGGVDTAALESLGFEDIKSRPGAHSGDIIWKRIRQTFATIYLGRLDALHDVITDARNSLAKYEKRVYESEKLIKKKSVNLKEEVHKGSLIELQNTFHSGLGITQDINKSISDDTAMVRKVLLDFVSECLDQTEDASALISKGKDLKASKYKHPIELFPSEYINEDGPFLRGTGFKVKGKFDPTLEGWEKFAQKGHLVMFESGDAKMSAFLRGLGVGEQQGNGFPHDLEFTTKDIEKTIGQFREYLKILKDYEKMVSYRKGKVTGMLTRLQTMDKGHEDSAEVMALIKVCGKVIDKPGLQLLKRSIRVTRNVGYLINRMAKFAK